MIKKSWLMAGLTSVVLMTGCQTNAGEQPTNLQRTANVDDQTANRSHYQLTQANDMGDYAQYGYSRYQQQQVDGNGGEQQFPVINRDRLADGVTRLVLTIPTVAEAATLVTDEHVLVAYDREEGKRELVADQVKRSAISIVPRYFNVYISDDHELFDDIERFKGLSSTNPAFENTLEQTIQEMKQSPQGQYDEETDKNQENMEKKQQQLRQQ